MCPAFQTQTILLFWIFLMSLESFYVPSMLFDTFYFISNHQWNSNKILYHHQSYQSIINQQSLDIFCRHWDFCALTHLLHNLDSHQSPSSLSSAIALLNLFQAHLNFILTYSPLMLGVVQSMSFIQSYKMGRRFPNGIVDLSNAHSSLVAKVCHFSTGYVSLQYHLLTFLILFLVLAMIPWLMIFAMASLNLIKTCMSMTMSSFLTTLLLPSASSWWSLAEWPWTLYLLSRTRKMKLPFWRLWMSQIDW